ncbi:CxxxxCH/CxxCH domain c-type cytochrome [Geomesophilobacter sediminis]|uniref:CxxxxCH/CxxCH domain-containing protein n=1 Tax=Geomesophilobacter sediminis TaxID=2798584 RepID=A0A8J7JLY6_9BACT|nr:CxxxxCH/CxxCH domain-containing protein [Geomesophilobacter sediminis]MBJ6725375.1 CxxxxCH/CxxCH domain-containing protein [Geomesophilobacter sediminis]
MKEVTVTTLLACLLWLVAAAPASAVTVDPPHGDYSCIVCHTGHVTLGSTGFNNICLSCHRPGVPRAGAKPFTLADASDPFGRYTGGGKVKLQTSHRWDGGDTVPAAGAEPPLFPALTSVRTKTGGDLACIRCHNQHSNANPPFLRMPNDQDQLCFDCHRSRNLRDQLSGTHPVNFGLTAPDSKAVLNPAQYNNPPVNANPANASSDLNAFLKGGKVVCSTCHRVHYADSNSATFDSYSSYYHLKDGDGVILRTDRRGAPVAAGAADNVNICTSCHAGKKNHNYRGQNVQCTDCHGAHVVPGDGSVPNSFLIRRLMNFSSPVGAVRQRPVFSTATSALSANFKDQSGTGVCQACHEVPIAVSPLHALPEAMARDCKDCHFHDNALGSFSGGCNICHGYPITTTNIGGPTGLATPATGVLGASPASAGAHGTHVTSKSIQCLACHSGYTQSPMGNHVLEMGFGVTPQTWFGFVGTVTTGTINANSSLNTGYSFKANPGTTLNLTPGGQVSCSIYCHGGTLTGGTNTTPVWTGTGQATCGSCHGASAANPPTTGSHLRHAGNGTSLGKNNLALDCSTCHGNVGAVRHVNGTVLWDVTKNGAAAAYRGAATGSTGTLAPSASYGQCSNTYCHSDVQGPGGVGGPQNFATPTWGGAALACNGCHQFDMTQPSAPGSHRKHFTSTIWGQTPTCDTCHFGAGGGTGKHADGNIDVVFAGGGSYSQSPNPPGNGYGSCAGTYCHSNGTSFTAPFGAARLLPTWNQPLPSDCSGCHGGLSTGPDYPNGTPKANSHAQHVAVNHLGCNACHASVTSDGVTITTPGNHMVQKYFVAAGGGAAFSVTALGTPASPTSCADISCHGGTGHGATWGASLGCQDCHLSASADLDVFSLPFTTASPVGNVNQAEWTTTGHGKTAGSYNSGNPAAKLAGTSPCLYCHDAGTGHNVAVNPFRMLNYSSAAWGRNQPCQSCHAPGSAGVSAGGVLVNATVKISSAHFGVKHGGANNAGQFCWDCHDPHGDGNDYMIHAQVALSSDHGTGAPGSSAAVSFVLAQPGTPAWGDFVKPGPAFNGVCQVCHTGTGASAVDHFPAGGFDANHNPGSSCVGCHSHNGAAPTLGFQPSGTCDTCHGYPPVSAGFVGTSGNWSSARLENYPGGGGAHTIAKHVSPKATPAGGFSNCSKCHNVLDHRMSPVTFLPASNVTVRVNPLFGYEFGKLARYSSNRQNGTAHVTGNCSNINCHFGASPKWDPQH